MGISCDATLAYGVPLPEYEIPSNLSMEEWDEAREVWKDEEIQARGYEVINACSPDAEQYFLAVPGTQKHVWWGQFERIEWTALGGVDVVQWRLALDKLGVDWKEEGWYLFTYYSY